MPKTTHGMSANSLYHAWYGMRARCNNPSATSYRNYGGRGIKVCERWDNIEAFISDMGERPEGTSLDRIDVNGDYEPANCRWATNRQQHRNRRVNNWLEFNGERLCVTDWADRIGIKPITLFGRLRKGWPLEKSLTTAPIKRGKGKLRLLTYGGESKSVAEWGRQLGLVSVLGSRLHRGWSVERALSEPIDTKLSCWRKS